MESRIYGLFQLDGILLSLRTGTRQQLLLVLLVHVYELLEMLLLLRNTHKTRSETFNAQFISRTTHLRQTNRVPH
jgi:hypothetical protein